MTISDLPQKGLEIRIAHEVPVIFHQLNRSHWIKYFNQFTFEQLVQMIRKLGIGHIPKGSKKPFLVGMLANYYFRRVQDGLTTTKI